MHEVLSHGLQEATQSPDLARNQRLGPTFIYEKEIKRDHGPRRN